MNRKLIKCFGIIFYFQITFLSRKMKNRFVAFASHIDVHFVALNQCFNDIHLLWKMEIYYFAFVLNCLKYELRFSTAIKSGTFPVLSIRDVFARFSSNNRVMSSLPEKVRWKLKLMKLNWIAMNWTHFCCEEIPISDEIYSAVFPSIFCESTFTPFSRRVSIIFLLPKPLNSQWIIHFNCHEFGHLIDAKTCPFSQPMEVI